MISKKEYLKALNIVVQYWQQDNKYAKDAEEMKTNPISTVLFREVASKRLYNILKESSFIPWENEPTVSEVKTAVNSVGLMQFRKLRGHAGLSPTEYRSGSSIRGRVRICKQGGKQLRHILYMCALNAKKTNTQCKALFDRLAERGKNKKAAVIAVCNKLLKIVFGVVKNKIMYQDNFMAKSA
ncbi:hypothetical protein ASG01_15520 [Chryseobacterium sp. Leaf180]|uniref:IS110 family transposase n=1 Tax=Chryseobacterium sp. Leaf180 TaxID=1736289 RepID=UPI0006FCF3AD|nr:IS110 family transposase [Chryseobacterium sp. Leaf180]KQR94191.1 hypothetical protein ASG01_15520 [Chryseobacterium sp. Leaf180]